jgi:hypothetical protein
MVSSRRIPTLVIQRASTVSMPWVVALSALALTSGCGGAEPDPAATGGASGSGGAGGMSSVGQGGAGGTGATGQSGSSSGGAGGASAGGTSGASAGSVGAGTSGGAGMTGGASGAGTEVGGAAGMSSSSAGRGNGGRGNAGRGGGNAGEGTGQAGMAGSVGGSGMAGSGSTTTEHFSFFVTSLDAVRRESGSEDGFGGDLGGLDGADDICTRIAELSLPGSGAKGWRAFLSTSAVDAISRIGEGPWYDRTGHLIAENVAGLMGDRPAGDATVANDLPNEDGVPNRAGTGTGMDDNHDTITATNDQGQFDGGSTCNDWTSATGSDGPRVGHSWPAMSGQSWMAAHTAPGCEPSVAIVQMGGGSGNGIGNGGGYGGFYCFALMP